MNVAYWSSINKRAIRSQTGSLHGSFDDRVSQVHIFMFNVQLQRLISTTVAEQEKWHLILVYSRCIWGMLHYKIYCKVKVICMYVKGTRKALKHDITVLAPSGTQYR